MNQRDKDLKDLIDHIDKEIKVVEKAVSKSNSRGQEERLARLKKEKELLESD